MIVSVDDSMMQGTRLTEGAFAENEEITGVLLPEGTEDIGEVAFFGCRNLREIRLPDSLKVIREEAFGESGLESVVIPEGVQRICEKAFFSCHDLRRIEVLPEDPVIEVDAFGDCPKLLEGYVACGYPQKTNPPEELLYTLLWCTCPERHRKETTERASGFVRDNEALIMERILKFNNTAALSGIVRMGLLKSGNIAGYVEQANRNRQTELVTLLLTAARATASDDDFDL